MKTKDLLQIIVAVLIFSLIGYLVYSFFVPSKNEGIKVEVITPIKPDFNQEALSQLSDGSKHRDFYTPPDLKNGIGNPTPFKPIR